MKKNKLKELKEFKKVLLLMIISSLYFTGCNNKNTSLNEKNQTELEYVQENNKEEVIEKQEEVELLDKKLYPKLLTDFGFIKKDYEELKKYEKVRILDLEDDNYLIKYGEKEYKVEKSIIKLLPENFIEVDISKQKLTFYKNNKAILKSPVVTGTDNEDRRTPIGYYETNNKAKSITLKGENYESEVDYWIAFIGHSYGFHDASWRNSFGGKIYINSGSHGCVNMPLNKVKDLYDKVDVGTKVLVHK